MKVIFIVCKIDEEHPSSSDLCQACECLFTIHRHEIRQPSSFEAELSTASCLHHRRIIMWKIYTDAGRE